MSLSGGGGGFLREVLQGSPHIPHGSSGSVSSANSGPHRLSARNSQAVKVILSESYIRWCSDANTLTALETLAKEMLAAAKAPAASQQQQQQSTRQPQPTPQSQAPLNSISALMQQQREQSSSASPMLVPSNPPELMPQPPKQQYHADPAQQQQAAVDAAAQEAQRSSSPSPPPSPPMRQRRKDVDRTPSPVQHSTRYLGVDELDTYAHHRASSPGAASPVSPTGAHMAPQPPMSKSLAEHAPLPAPVHSTAPNLDTATFVGDSNSPSGRGSSPVEHHKFVSSSGPNTFAVQPAQQVPLASLHDVPPFFNKLDPEGCLRDVRVEELDVLANFFAVGNTRPGGSSMLGLNKGGPGSSSRLGKPAGSSIDIDTNKTVRKVQFGKICKEVFGIPMWLKDALFRRIAVANGLTDNQPLNYHFIKKFYDTSFGRLTPNRRLFELLRQNPRSAVLTIDDLKAAIKHLVDAHPGLEFLKQPEFQDSYCRTVAIRIMYELEVRHSRCVAWPQFDRSDLPNIMRDLDDTPDINQVLRFFSYEHFYVLYCRFWELDSDRDQLVGLQDILNYGQGALTPSVLTRVVQGAGRRLTSGVPGKLDFEDFVYFCLSEEDKNNPQAVYYWFKVLDIDCDGVLSGFELGKFFEENRQRFQEAVADELKYEDMLCQMLDMVGANKIKVRQYGLALGDLRSCETPANFFNMLFNANKFLNFEHRDPFAEHQQKLQPEKTDWDRFARVEYDRMANEVS